MLDDPKQPNPWGKPELPEWYEAEENEEDYNLR